jgi:hypothetical protein
MKSLRFAAVFSLVLTATLVAAEKKKAYINFADSEGAFVSTGVSPKAERGSSGGCAGARCGAGEGQGFKSSGDAPATSPSDTVPITSHSSDPGPSRVGRDGGVIAEWRDLMGYGADTPAGGGRGGGGFDAEMEKAIRSIPASKDGNRLDRMMRSHLDKDFISVDLPSQDLQSRALTEFGIHLNEFLKSNSVEAPQIPYLPPPLTNEVIHQVHKAYDKIFWNLHHVDRSDDLKLANWYAARVFEGMEAKRLPLYEKYATKVEAEVAKFGREFLKLQDNAEVKSGVQAPEIIIKSISDTLQNRIRTQAEQSVSPEEAASRSVKRRLGLVAPLLRRDHPFYSDESERTTPQWESKPGKFRESLDQIHERLSKAKPTNIQGVTARGIGLRAVKSADHAYASGDKEVASAYKEVALFMTDIALGFVPFVGVGRDLYEAVSGQHLLTGCALTDSERFVAALGVVTLGSVGMVKAGLQVLKSEARLGRAGQVIIKSLDNVLVRSAESVNLELKTTRYTKDTYRAKTKVFEFTVPVRIEGEYVRVFHSSGASRMEGHWFLEKKAIEGLSPNQIARKFALKVTPDAVVDVVVSEGLRLRKGVPAKVMLGVDSKDFPRQFEIIDELGRVEFKNPRPLD